ncbi:MAG: hypothetical protein LBK82_17575 [Planctomycetaceae bacterium]|jgi:hypothetical protein|nr:hypothetical protein [Planctomycetaceae bacterium]
MTPKKGQLLKPKEEIKSAQACYRMTESEMKILKDAYKLSKTELSFSRWITGITVKEALRIIEAAKK